MIICWASLESHVAADTPTSAAPVERLSTCHGIFPAILCTVGDTLLAVFRTFLLILESISSQSHTGFIFVACPAHTKLSAAPAIPHSADKSFASSGFDFSKDFHCWYACTALSFVNFQGAVSIARVATSFADSLTDFGTNVCIPLEKVFQTKSWNAYPYSPTFLKVLLSPIGIVALFLLIFSALFSKSPHVFRMSHSSLGMFLIH